MMSNGPPLASPHQLAHFDIIRRLGAGGMAEVFLSKKRGAEGTYKVLVVKRILPTHGGSRRFRTMFVEEAQLATRLNHPNVVQVFEFYDGGDEGQLLAMEYVEGPDLGLLMSSAKAKGTRVPPWVAAWIIAEAAKGLHYAHEKKDEGGAPLEIVHRDVSPQNVLLSYEGAVKIADFGIASAKLVVEEAGVLKGKFGYMSPEQARGEKVDRRSDLYALGVIFWELVAGRSLHSGLSGDALLEVVRSGSVEKPSVYNSDVPEELEAIILKALHPRREDRIQTGRDLSTAIGRALLQRQELVDATTLEATISQLVTREEESHGPSVDTGKDSSRGLPEDEQTQVAAPLARASTGRGAFSSYVSVDSTSDATSGLEFSDSDSAAPSSPGPREVRHVAVVTLRLHGIDRLEAQEQALAARTLDRLRTMLGDIAYKRNMRCWIWSRNGEAMAVAGLTSNPSRAAADAAWLALDTHEAIAGINEDLPVELSASIAIVRGIASGIRDVQGNLVRYTLHEPAAYLAQILGGHTPVSHTWVAGGVYRLVRRDFRWGDAPTLDLLGDAPMPGLPPTMRIYALERSLSREERLAEVSTAPNDLVGRDAEKADLFSAYHRAMGSPERSEVTCRAVIGELGIGKTALVATFLSELPPNVRLIRAECSPVRMDIPLSTIADLIRDAVGTTGDEPYERVAHLLARAMGASGYIDASDPAVIRLADLATNRQLGSGEEGDAHYRHKLLLGGLRMLFRSIAAHQPVILMVEGLQWSDKQTLEVLRELVLGSGEHLPLFVLFVTRNDDRVAAVLDGVVRIELLGLSTDEQVRLVETRLGVREGVSQVCADLMPRVAGNPFFLLEMVDALLERGTLEIREVEDGEGDVHPVLVRVEGSDSQSAAALPSTLEQLLGDRLRELPIAEHAVVDWLAIAAGPLLDTDIRKLTHGADDEAVVRLCARGVCDRKGEAIDFRHPLTRDVAYLALDAAERARMHCVLGEHLSQTSTARGVSAAIIARHFARGDAPERAAHYYLDAARAARTGYQTALAVRYYKRASTLLSASDLRQFEVHEALENTFRLLGRRRDRLFHLEALRSLAREKPRPRVVAIALLRIARFDLDEGLLAAGLPMARRAAETAHAASLATLEIEAEELVSELLREFGDMQGALAACDRALAACNPNVNPKVPPRVRAEVLRSQGVLLRRVGRVREAVDAYLEAIAIFRRAGAMRQEARAKNSLAFAMFVQGRYEDAIALLLECIQVDLLVGGRFQLANTLTKIGHAYARVGDSARAQAYLKRARDAHERYGDQVGRADTLIVSAEVMLESGELDLAESFLSDAGALNSVTDNAYDKTHERLVRSLVARARRDANLSIAQAMEARRAAEEQSLVSFQYYAAAVEAAGRVDAGETHTATLLATMALGSVETLQGCEYGLEIRVLAADALKRSGSPQAPHAHARAVEYATSLVGSIRDTRLRQLFFQRALVAALFDSTPIPSFASRGAVLVPSAIDGPPSE